MLWNVPDILEAAHRGLAAHAADLQTEQAVYGIDALDELQLHPIIQSALRRAGFGVFPEQRYPSDRAPRSKRSQGKRCDLALTPDGRALCDPDAEQTLFGDPDAISLESAYWLEIKTVAQFTTEGPSPQYSKELLSPVSLDIRKLAQDRLIFHAGLMLVLFTMDRQTAELDLETWRLRCLSKGFPVAHPTTRHTPITDRLGNGHMAAALFPIRRL